ncbi:hypothetical protein LTR86_007751 [Recurvomyces mirabilis]|nr:hypothetical protein LTR86_007751 [Recurvomyces mirabilis]
MELRNLKAGSEAQQALIRTTDVSPDRAPESISPEPRSKWKNTVSIGAALATVVLATNVAILAWVKSSAINQDGVATVFEGSCDVTEKAVTGADLAINVLSTLLLGASNHNAQLLSAPTRQDLDRQHARGLWLNVGVSSVRNLRHIPRWRTVIWATLLMSTIPLHLLYNSVVFTTRSAVNYQAALVTKDFLTGGSWSTYTATSVRLFETPQLIQTQKNVDKLIRLDPATCLKVYGSSMYETQWRNLLVITSLSSTNSSLLNVYTHQVGDIDNDIAWVCHGDIHNNDSPTHTGCSPGFLRAADGSWSIPSVPACPINYPGGGWQNVFNGSAVCEDENRRQIKYDAPVEYCLAEPFQPHCTVGISTDLLMTVVVCNVLKIICMLVTLGARDFRPLATVGDAIDSFMERPDPATFGKGALEVGAVSSGVWRELDRYAPLPWTRHKRRWWYAIPRIQLNLTFLCFFLGWLAAIIALIKSVKSTSSFSTFGAIDTTNVVSSSLNASLVANVVLANTPQLLISFIYVFYNDAFTRMLMSHEYSQFATTRKSLRVTRPRGQQRSTYWLQLPFRYVVPMMSLMVLLHWLVSRSLFLVRMSVYDIAGLRAPDQDIYGCGFSPLAILLALCVGTIMIVVLVVLGRFRFIEAGMPAASSCSVALSAAAHPAENEGDDVALLPLQYGVVSGRASPSDVPYTGTHEYGARRFKACSGRRQHACFSSKEVRSLENGVVYQ